MDFLFNAGTSWSGTTSFYYTCIRTNSYCHTGNQKETGYLVALHKRGTPRARYVAMRLQFSEPNHLWQRVPGREFNEINDTIDFYSEPFTIDKYLSYYTRLGDRVKGSFQTVGDFTNHNWNLPEKFLIELRERMKEHFENIRVTFQFRDPIRRYFSRCGSLTQKGESHIENFQETLKNATVSDGDQFNKRRSDWKLAHYTQGIQKFERVFGKENVYPIVMEELWDTTVQKEQEKKLKEFLGYSISLNQSTITPERKHRHHGNKNSLGKENYDVMTPELYEWALKYMGFAYDDWEEYFGAIPKYWKC